MGRENFYIILDLSLAPPEKDPVKIEKAIKKKQSEWSRLRSHPTKGIAAQHLIGMIPEIRKVMTDPALREKEARMALEFIRNRKAEKFSDIDRHLDILMSKGFIKDEEIFKLAKYHKISQSEIRSRIQLKEQEKYSELDKQIQNRLKKGYIAEDEISALAKIHGLAENLIRSRIKGPIKKESASVLKKSKLLDPSIVKVIEDNLKIVGKSSLYDFLGIDPTAELEELQKRAKEKEAEILKSRKKDSIATAGGVLVGHCISLFRNPSGKASYDAARVRSHLSEMDSDIEVAGIEGTIRIDNFEFLVGRAVELGMDYDEAVKYIQNYCKKKNWSIETPKKQRKGRKPGLLHVAALAIFLMAGGYQGFKLYDDYTRKNEYENLMANVESQGMLDDKIQVLNKYLLSHETHKYTGLINQKYAEYKTKKEEQDLESALAAAKRSISEGKLDEALEIYRDFAARNPKNPRLKGLNKEIAELEKSIEQRDYKELENALRLEASERIAAYAAYLNKYPAGEGRENVLKLLADLGDTYYVTLTDELADCEKRKQYEDCLRLADTFIKAFPDDRRSEILRKNREIFEQKIRENMVLTELKKKASEKGMDFVAARKIYETYLVVNSESPLKSRIEEEMETLDKTRRKTEHEAELERRAALLRETGGRFSLVNENTVSDSRTGLMWQMWDSTHSSIECMDYQAALEYVASLETGGYDDWRIPAPKELIGVYKTKPFFPFGEAEWYWSSVSYKSYYDGWIQTVEIVTTEQNTSYQVEQVDSRKCGAVRAVRP